MLIFFYSVSYDVLQCMTLYAVPSSSFSYIVVFCCALYYFWYFIVMSKNKIMTLRIQSDLQKKIEAEAVVKDLSASHVIRKALEEHFQHQAAALNS